MFPVQFILLLLIASMPQISASAGAPPRHAAPFPWPPLLWLLMGQMIIAFLALRRAKSALRRLGEPSGSPTTIAQQAEQFFSRARWITVLLTAILLNSTALPQGILDLLAHLHFPRDPDGQFPILPELLFITPALLAWLVIWTGSYFVQSATHECLLPYQLARELPVHEMPSLRDYLAMQARHNFFPFAFLLLETAAVWIGFFLVRHFPFHMNPAGEADRASMVSSILGVALTLVFLPWLLIPMWSTAPLTGALRQRLDRVASRYSLRFRNILIWRTHHMVSNAAVLGWVPFARYFLLSDALLETLSDRQIEAVFAHEVGHGVHRHIPWYIVTIGGAIALAMACTGASLVALESVFHLHDAQTQTIAPFLLILFWCAAAGLSIPLVAPRFENQADWFACRHLAQSLQESPAPTVRSPAPSTAPAITLEQYRAGEYAHAASSPPHATMPATAPPILPAQVAAAYGVPDYILPSAPILSVQPPMTNQQAGAEIFIAALDAVVETSQRDRDRRGWMHPSVSQRMKLLRDLASYPAAAQQFNRRMVRLRWIIAIYFVIAVGLGVLTAILTGMT